MKYVYKLKLFILGFFMGIWNQHRFMGLMIRQLNHWIHQVAFDEFRTMDCGQPRKPTILDSITPERIINQQRSLHGLAATDQIVLSHKGDSQWNVTQRKKNAYDAIFESDMDKNRAIMGNYGQFSWQLSWKHREDRNQPIRWDSNKPFFSGHWHHPSPKPLPTPGWVLHVITGHFGP